MVYFIGMFSASAECLFGGRVMMNLVQSGFQGETEAIMELIAKNTANQFLYTYIENPPVSHLRIRLLQLMLHEGGAPKERVARYVATTALVQLGLDSHETVTLARQRTMSGIRNRQLTILAGDYFSSRYYDLLAQIDDVRTVAQLARSIQEINEWKIRLYGLKGGSAELYLDGKVKMESALILSFVETWSKQKETWKGLVNQLLRAEELLKEYRKQATDEEVGSYVARLNAEVGVHGAHQQLVAELHKALHQSRKFASQLSDDVVRTELKLLIDGCATELDSQKARAEER